jgi:hypothetical protein
LEGHRGGRVGGRRDRARRTDDETCPQIAFQVIVSTHRRRGLLRPCRHAFCSVFFDVILNPIPGGHPDPRFKGLSDPFQNTQKAASKTQVKTVSETGSGMGSKTEASSEVLTLSTPKKKTTEIRHRVALGGRVELIQPTIPGSACPVTMTRQPIGHDVHHHPTIASRRCSHLLRGQALVLPAATIQLDGHVGNLDQPIPIRLLGLSLCDWIIRRLRLHVRQPPG